MVEQINLESLVFENARRFHEKYLLNFQEQDLQGAIESYAEVLSINPDNAECYYRLASLMYDSGQITLESTLEQCQKAIKLNPKNINAYIYAGYYSEEAKDFKSAESFFKKAIKLSELKSARARLILSSTFRKKIETFGFNLLDAVQFVYYFLTGTVTIFADIPAVNMIYNVSKDFSKVLCFRSVGKLLEKLSLKTAIEFYKKAMQKTHKISYFYGKMAKLYLSENDIEHAIDCYKEILKVDSSDKNAVIQLATLIQANYPDKVDEVISYYTRLLELEEDDLSPIYYELGHLYIQKNDKINAVSAFKLALENNEDNPYYNDALAYAYVQAELYDDAIEYYQKAIKLNPDKNWTVAICYTLGLIYQKCKENYDAAIASFQAGVILDSKNEQILLALGDLYSVQKDYDAAIRTYHEVIDINDENFEAYSKLGIVLWAKKYTHEAVCAYEKALEINPEHEITLNNLGVVYLEEYKEYETALEYFDKAISINPNYTLAYFNRGRTYKDMGNFKKSASDFQMAVILNKVTKSIDEKDLQNSLNELFNI